MKVLLTGGSGFLGSHVAEQLSAQGAEVRALVRPTSDSAFLRTLRGVELVTGAVEDRPSLDQAVAGVDAVIHAAGLVKARRPEDFAAVNVQGTRNLLDAIVAHGSSVRRFVFVSSQTAVGPSFDGRPVDPNADRPVNAYGRSKAEAERVARERADRLQVVIVRPSFVYGPRDRETLSFFQSIASRALPMFGDGSMLTSVVYGPDAARACIRAAEADVPSGSAYFLEDGHPYVWRHMLEDIERAMGVRALWRIGLPIPVLLAVAFGVELFGRLTGRAMMLTRDKVAELRGVHWVCDGSAARRDLGWQPTVDWTEGTRLTVDWYRAHGWL
jgi:nucleoside-diphosphate-sugar epimerase